MTYSKVSNQFVHLGDDRTCNIEGIGSISLQGTNGRKLLLQEVRHIPELAKNLIFAGQLDSAGCSVIFGVGSWRVTKGALVLAHGQKEGSMYTLHATAVRGNIAVAEAESISLWHKRLGHLSETGMKVLISNNMLPKLNAISLDFCKDCAMAKSKHVNFRKRFPT